LGRPNYRIDKLWEERRTKEIIDSGFFRYPISIITDKETQKKGVDIWLHSPAGRIGVELKIVRYDSSIGAITIETHSNLRKNPGDEIGDGWINYSRADWLIWAFIDTAYIWKMPDLRFWFYLQDLNRWPIYDIDNGNYITRCRKVPIADIPIPFWKRGL